MAALPHAKTIAVPIARISGVVAIKEKPPVNPVGAIVETLIRLTEEGNVASWYLVDVLPQLKDYHWAAYAREADVPAPGPDAIPEIIAAFKARIGYP